jgi:hypothetical protein
MSRTDRHRTSLKADRCEPCSRIARLTPSTKQASVPWASVRECHPTLNYAFDDGAESVLRSERPFDSRDDVQERDYPGNLEDPFDDRHTPQHDIELATEFDGVFLRL